MPTRRKSLTKAKDGNFWVNLGWKLTKTGNRSQAKFKVGNNAKDADRRSSRLEQLWDEIELLAASRKEDALWAEQTLEFAKLLANGELQVVIARLEDEIEDDFVGRINSLSQSFPSVNFVPDDFEAFQYGEELIDDYVQNAIETITDSFKVDPTKLISKASKGTLHKALDAYIEWIRREYFDPNEGAITDNGMTKVRQVKTLKDHLRDRSLSAITDFNGVDSLFSYFRKRPISQRTQKPMKRKSCQNYMGELSRFLDWLDTSDDWDWRLPERYSRIKRKVDELDSDVDAEAEDIFVFSKEQLRTLFEYAGPIDRLFISLGLNCAFGADQTGRLQTTEVLLDKKHPIIRRIRRKKKVLGKHLLWPTTQILLRWAFERRDELAGEESANFLILKQSGKPYWRKTISGNRARDIPNSWDRLIKRIREDQPDFPKVGFNVLRDTSIHNIRSIAGQEIASIHATHKHHSPDKNLLRYSNAPWKNVFRAQLKLGKRFESVFDSVSDPTVAPKQAYTSLGKRQRAIELHSQGVSVKEIAAEIGVHFQTVYRILAGQI